MYEDKQSLVGVLTHLTSRSPAMMSEFRKLFLLTDENNIRIRTKYIRSAANILADKLSRETDISNLQLARRVFQHLDSTYHKLTIDRFASKETSNCNATNESWRDGKAEAVDSLHLTDEA